MSSQTTNLNLTKIDLTDAPPDITVLNDNWDIIDALFGDGGFTTKHLLQYDGDIKENGERITFPTLYNMLMVKSDFVVLVNSGKAFHPNVVNNNEITFVATDTIDGYIVTAKITMKNDGYSTVEAEVSRGILLVDTTTNDKYALGVDSGGLYYEEVED